MHKGIIGAKSDGEGCGTEFYFDLPLSKLAAPKLTPISTPTARDRMTPRGSNRGSDRSGRLGLRNSLLKQAPPQQTIIEEDEQLEGISEMSARNNATSNRASHNLTNNASTAASPKNQPQQQQQQQQQQNQKDPKDHLQLLEEGLLIASAVTAALEGHRDPEGHHFPNLPPIDTNQPVLLATIQGQEQAEDQESITLDSPCKTSRDSSASSFWLTSLLSSVFPSFLLGRSKHCKIHIHGKMAATAASVSSRSRENSGYGGGTRSREGTMVDFLNYPVKMLVRKMTKHEIEYDPADYHNEGEGDEVEEERGGSEDYDEEAAVVVVDGDEENLVTPVDRMPTTSDRFNETQKYGELLVVRSVDHDNNKENEDAHVVSRHLTVEDQSKSPDEKINNGSLLLTQRPSPEQPSIPKKTSNKSTSIHSHDTTRSISCDSEIDSSRSTEQQLGEGSNRKRRNWNSGLTILVVDDAAMNRKLCSKLLKLDNKNHIIYEAVDGKDCLRLFDELTCPASVNVPPCYIDLILTDDNMPNLVGYETTKILRKEKGYSGVIVGVTGDLYPEAIKRFKDNGANDVMSKPLDIKKLKDNYQNYS
jgi:CheY-like chemotaxis protein